MKIQNITFTSKIYKQEKQYKTKPMSGDTATFTAQKPDKKFLKANRYAKIMKTLGIFVPMSIYDYNFNKLDGIQHGIKIFDGLNIKEIAFIFDNLHGIAVKRGCSNQCLHCYANALPPAKENNHFINKMSYEDYNELMDGVKELNHRLGQPISYSTRTPYTDIYYDADCMEIALYDKLGNEHDYIDLIEKFYNATKCPSIFDTAGWNPKNSKMQARAEKYVKYFLDYDNKEKFYQINLSLSPFNAIYARALELGFNPKDYKIIEELANTSESKGESLYRIYIKRMANALYTFTPLLGSPNFNTIARPMDNSEKNMKNFTVDDYEIISTHILQTLQSKYINDLMTNQKYIKDENQIQYSIKEYSKLLGNYDTSLLPSGRFKDLYLKKNPNITEEEFETKFNQSLTYKRNYEKLKNTNNLCRNLIRYFKIIDTNGKLYLYDGYRLIPTEVSLNLNTKDKLTPKLSPDVVKDFIVTKDIINNSR